MGWSVVNMSSNQHKPFSCEICHSRFARKDTLKRHSLNKHSSLPLAFECQVCGIVFKKHESLLKHRKLHADDNQFREIATALNHTVKVFGRRLESGQIDISKVQAKVSQDALETILNELNACLRSKVSLVMIFELAKQGPDGEILDLVTIPFRARSFEAVRYSDHRAELYDGFDQIKNIVNNFNENGSSWIILNILEVRLEMGQCRPLNGKCGDVSVLHPKKLKSLKMIQSRTPHDCFYQAVAAHFVETDDKAKISKFIDQHVNKLSHEKNSGMEVRQIKRFEEINPQLSVRINVLGEENTFEGSVFHPLLFSSNLEAENTINLILVNIFNRKDLKNPISRHYILARDMQKLLRVTYGEGDKLSYQKTYPCMNCLTRFSSARLLRKHEPFCMKNSPQTVQLSERPNTIKFSKHMTKFKHPFIGFLDMESKCENPKQKCRTCKNEDECQHKSNIEKNQLPISYCLVILDLNDRVIFDRSYVGEDCVRDLDQTLRKVRKILGKKIACKKPLRMSEEDEQRFLSASTCHICEKPFLESFVRETSEETVERIEKKDVSWVDKHQEVACFFDREDFFQEIIVRDHCHIRGHFMGAAHQACNLNRRLKSTMPVPIYCHNFSGANIFSFLYCCFLKFRILLFFRI